MSIVAWFLYSLFKRLVLMLLARPLTDTHRNRLALPLMLSSCRYCMLCLEVKLFLLPLLLWSDGRTNYHIDVIIRCSMGHPLKCLPNIHCNHTYTNIFQPALIACTFWALLVKLFKVNKLHSNVCWVLTGWSIWIGAPGVDRVCLVVAVAPWV